MSDVWTRKSPRVFYTWNEKKNFNHSVSVLKYFWSCLYAIWDSEKKNIFYECGEPEKGLCGSETFNCKKSFFRSKFVMCLEAFTLAVATSSIFKGLMPLQQNFIHFQRINANPYFSFLFYSVLWTSNSSWFLYLSYNFILDHSCFTKGSRENGILWV